MFDTIPLSDLKLGNFYNHSINIENLDKNSKDYYKLKHKVPEISKEDIENASDDKKNEYFIGLILGGYIPKESLSDNNSGAFSEFRTHIARVSSTSNTNARDIKVQISIGGNANNPTVLYNQYGGKSSLIIQEISA